MVKLDTKSNPNSSTGGASKRVPQTPEGFLASYSGRKVRLRAFGAFNDVTFDRNYVTYAMQRRNYIEGVYKVDVIRGLRLWYPHHFIDVIDLKWVEIDGQRVGASDDE